MTISDAEKIDFLWKKVIYGVSKTAGATTKAGSNEYELKYYCLLRMSKMLNQK